MNKVYKYKHEQSSVCIKLILKSINYLLVPLRHHATQFTPLSPFHKRMLSHGVAKTQKRAV